MIFDLNLAVGHWPFRPLAYAEPAAMAAYLRENNVVSGVVRSFEAPFYDDLAAANALLATACRQLPGFIPGHAVRPDYGFWRDLAGAPVAVLYPTFHNYCLGDNRTLEMVRTLAAAGTVLLVVMREEDERNQNPRFPVPGLGAAELNNLALAVPEAKIVALGPYWRDLLEFTAPNLWAEISFVEAFRTFAVLQEKVPLERLLFGSHFPFFVHAAARLKLELDDFAPAAVAAVKCENARKLFPDWLPTLN